MANKRETGLWKELDRMILIASVLGLIILIGVYFVVANAENIDVPLQELILSIITNIIPTLVLFIGAYLIFRRIEKLRSEKDADEIADKVISRLIEIAKVQPATSNEGNDLFEQPIKFSELEMRFHRELGITNKHFDSKSKPQEIVLQFTNRGNNVIHLKKVTYSDTGSGLPMSLLSRSYRLDNGRDLLIDQNTSEILPDGQYNVELCFDEKQDVNKINRWSGNGAMYILN